MDQSERIGAIKHELATIAASKKARITKWTRDCPTEWRPTTVIDPRTKEVFTPNGAWDFVVELLENPETEIEEIVLDTPKNKNGYVIKHMTEYGEIYIKLMFGMKGGTIIGRSFHD